MEEFHVKNTYLNHLLPFGLLVRMNLSVWFLNTAAAAAARNPY